MLSTKKITGFALATAAASLFAASPVMADAHAETGKVMCTGVNACKGKSECKTASNACKGQNSCKGKGMVHTKTDKECTDKGGKAEKQS